MAALRCRHRLLTFQPYPLKDRHLPMATKKSPKKAPQKRRSFSRALLWSVCFLLLLLALDQMALRLKPTTPLLQELQSSYREFRSRLLGRPAEPPLTIEAVIDRDTTRLLRKAPAAPPPQPAPNKHSASVPSKVTKPPAAPPAADRYIYVDADGELQFADSLEDIPPALRKDAQPMKD
jgi:hypothetical protein